MKPIVTPDGSTLFYTLRPDFKLIREFDWLKAPSRRHSFEIPLSDSLYPNNSVSFSDAKEFCETKGMILPVPKSPSENYLIWIEKEKTSDINLELIWLGTGSRMNIQFILCYSLIHFT